MEILVLGGTRFFGIHLVEQLLAQQHHVTIATRGITEDSFGDAVQRLVIDRKDPENLKKVLHGKTFDVVYDNIAYSSNDIKYLLDVIQCKRYILTSSSATYRYQKIETEETAFDQKKHALIWTSAPENYAEGKRLTEAAVFQAYSQIPAVAVRIPYVIGENDYTERLFSYVEHVIKEEAMTIDNRNAQISFIHEKEAGAFLAWLADKEYVGAINGNNLGTLSIQEVFDYIEEKTGLKAILTEDGYAGPYNGTQNFSLSTTRAETLGFTFTPLKSWIYELLDSYIERAQLED